MKAKVYRPFNAPRSAAGKRVTKTGGFRGSSRERGYDARWDRLSLAFRKKHPFCAWCIQEGRDGLTDLVDHVLPVVDRPELRHEWSNLMGLCRECHGRKTSMEVYARERGELDYLPAWCSEVTNRPPQFVSINPINPKV